MSCAGCSRSALAVIAVVIEWSEHIASDEEAITPAFFGEVFLFAVVGPVAVALTLRWMAQIIGGYRATAAALESMNRSLEAKVAERTRHLEEATAKLAAANDNLRQLDRMKSEFVSLVSHQLRAPLTNIHGALEIVAQDAELLPPASRRTLQILTLESDRLSGLIQTILDVSRIESGRLTLRLGPVAVEPLLARSCAASLEAEPGRPLSFDVPRGPATRMGRRDARRGGRAEHRRERGPLFAAGLTHRGLGSRSGRPDRDRRGRSRSRRARIGAGPDLPLVLPPWRHGDHDQRLRPGPVFRRQAGSGAAGRDQRRKPRLARRGPPGARFIVTLPIAAAGS